MLRAAILLLLCQCAFAQNAGGRIEGRVINSATGEPLRKAEVQLHGGPGGEMSATTDASGNFAIDQVPPGSYNLTAQHQNFAIQSYGARRSGMPGSKISVSAGQRVSGLEFRLIPFGVISGKVVDEDGDPVSGVMVMVLKRAYFRGGARLSNAGNSSSTNDRGEFRAYNLPAGHYYVMAQAFLRGRSDRQSYVNTFYPSAPEPSSAAVITLGPGQEVSGRDVQIRKARMFTVSGKVSGMESARGVSISLYPADTSMSVAFGMNRAAQIRREDGSFKIQSVAPGAYTLIAMANNRLAARQDVSVGDADLEGVIVNLVEPGTVKGRVSVENPGANLPKLQGLRVSLTPVGNIPMNSPNAATNGDGTFNMEEVPAARLSVNCTPVEGTYLKTVLWNGQVSNDDTIQTSGGASGTLDLIFAPTSAEIDGDVKLDDQPAPGASVLLVPASGRESDFRYLMADQNGHFAAKGVAPGGYTALALDAPMYGMPDPAFVKSLDKYTAYTKVDQNGQATVSLNLISDAEIEAAQ